MRPPPATAAGSTRGASAGLQAARESLRHWGIVVQRDGLAILALAFLAVVSYYPAMVGGFVWDDLVILVQSAPIQELSGLVQIWFAPGSILSEGHYWPLLYTTFWLEHRLWGLDPTGYHIVNVLLHSGNVFLVWRLLLRLNVPGAWVAAAIFAVHPVHVEAVAWVIARKDLLSALFYLSATLTWLRFMDQPRLWAYCLMLLLFIAGLLCKSMGITLPVALLILCWWKQGRVGLRDLRLLVPLFAVGLGIGLADLWYYYSQSPIAVAHSMLERLLIAAHSLWFYAGKLVWPSNLAVIYPRWEVSAGELLDWLPLVAVVLLVALLWFWRWRIGRGPLAGVLFFAVALSPVLGFIPFRFMEFAWVADRYQYLAGLGLLAALIGGAVRLSAMVRAARWIPEGIVLWGGRACILLGLTALGTLTWRQGWVYQDDITFFRHVIALNPDAHLAYGNLATGLIHQDRAEEALAIYRELLQRAPDSPDAHAGLGHAFMQLDRDAEAEHHLLRALDIAPGNRNALQNLAELRRTQRRYEEALQWYNAVIETAADYALAHAGKGVTLYYLRRFDEAIKALQRAAALQLRRPSIHLFMGMAAEELGHMDAAVGYYERALAMDPGMKLARTRLGGLRGRANSE